MGIKQKSNNKPSNSAKGLGRDFGPASSPRPLAGTPAAPRGNMCAGGDGGTSAVVAAKLILEFAHESFRKICRFSLLGTRGGPRRAPQENPRVYGGLPGESPGDPQGTPQGTRPRYPPATPWISPGGHSRGHPGINPGGSDKNRPTQDPTWAWGVGGMWGMWAVLFFLR